MPCKLCGAELPPQARRCPGCGAWLRGGIWWWVLLIVLLVGLPLWQRYRDHPSARARDRERAGLAACWQGVQARQVDADAAAALAEECRRMEARLHDGSGP